MPEGINKTVLENGVRILTKKMPHVHSISMGVWVNVGARDESANESGLSHFIEHMIFKGTGKRSAYQIAKEFDAIGGHTNAFTSMENTCYHARVMDTHLDTMAEILSDIFLNSVFDTGEIEKERPVIFQEIGMVEDSPEDYIHVLLGQAFWGSHALGRSVLGTRRNIINFNRDILLNYFQRLYQPDRILISAAGNVDHDRFVDIVGPAFASVETGNGLPDRTMPKGLASAAVHPREIEQAHLCLCTNGLSITDPNRYGFSLMNTLLGGNMSSRLFQEIREQRGLAYSVYSFMSSHSDAGMFGAYAGVDPKNVRESLRLIIKEMNRIKQTAVADDELRDAKEFTKGSLLLASESVDNQMVRLAQNEIHFGDQIPLQEVVARIEAVTPDEIRELAARLFQSDQLTLTILGPVDDTEPFNELLVL